MQTLTTWTSFDLIWPWIGLGFAIVFLILLFSTDRLRHDPAVSRWHDPVWFSWLAIPIYMIHQFEEYGIDLLGQRHAFPDALCTNLNLGIYPSCPIPHEFYLYVNLPLVWVIGLINSRFSLRNPLVGLGLYSIVISNGMAHILIFLLRGRYNPGLFTAVVVFLPSFFWMCRVCFGKARIPGTGIGILVATGILVHGVLISSIFAFIGNRITGGLLDTIQLVNSTFIFFIPFLGSRLLKRA
jgi:hypothetical protein